MNNDNLGPAMSTSMNAGAKKSGRGLMTSIVIIVLVIVVILLMMSKNKMTPEETGTMQGENAALSPADEQAAGTEATAGFSTSDDLDSIETDLNAAEASEFE